MRKIFFLLLILSILFLIQYLMNVGNTFTQPRQLSGIVANDTPTPLLSDNTNTQIIEIKYNNKQYRVSWFVVKDANNLSLIPNFSEKPTSVEIKQKYQCQKIINAGFYTPEAKPLGLFIENNRQLAPAIQSNLVTHFLGSTSDGKFFLDNNLPKEIEFAVQTGPLLFTAGKAVKLTIQNDEFDRRMIAADTNQGLLFATIYDKNNSYLGPKLSDLPAIIAELQSLIGVNLLKVVNLDGGSASVFDNGKIFLQELTPVGSFFCLK